MLFDALTEYVRRTLSCERFLHSRNTAKTAVRLAKQVGTDCKKAFLAGLLHDIAREDAASDLLLEARANGIIVRTVDIKRPVLLHGKVAAVRARALGIDDPSVLLAIASHVAGRRGWTLLEQLVYLADKIEPARDHPGVGEVRILVQKGHFPKALKKCLANAIIWAVQDDASFVDPETVVVFNEIP